MKKILVTGNGKSGSWKIRGDQLGTAIGATIVPHITMAKDYSLAIIIKRPDLRALNVLRAARIPIVWDIVDAWPQPHGNLWEVGECIAWLGNQIKVIKPFAIVAPTQAMARDVHISGFLGPILTLPHHARPNQTLNPIRERMHIVGYEGGVAYLGKWASVLQNECAKRDWGFVCNPPQLADVDIVVALREVQGYAATRWKSNVKLANAQGSGTPFIGSVESGYVETSSGAELWADTPKALKLAFDALTTHGARDRAATILHACTPTLEFTASKYLTWLESL